MATDVPRNHHYGPDSSSPPWGIYCACWKWELTTVLLNSVLFLRAKHQPQTGRSHWEARPAEQAAIHSSLLQSHRGSSPQHSLHGREAKEPESIQNAKEPGSFPGVQHRRYREVHWVGVCRCGITLLDVTLDGNSFAHSQCCLLSLWSTTHFLLLIWNYLVLGIIPKKLEK